MWLPRNSIARRVVIAIAFTWTFFIACLLAWSVSNEILQTKAQAAHQARTFFQEFLLTRFWNSTHGGVYVIADEITPPNPYLDDSLRDITTVEGLTLTKMNPSYMTRQISQIAETRGGFRFHISSLNPIRPENKADPWETKALKSFQSGSVEKFELVTTDSGNKAFRYMGTLQIEQSCLHCHDQYGVKEGDMYGGISVTLPAELMLANQNRYISFLAGAYFILWFIGMLGLWFSFNKIDLKDQEQEVVIHKLEETLKEVKKLSGLLPICSTCNKIRDDKGYWQMLEKYISSHSEAQFSHGICPDCANHLYPDIAERVRKKKEKNPKETNNLQTE
jgi:hypothetical protein